MTIRAAGKPRARAVRLVVVVAGLVAVVALGYRSGDEPAVEHWDEYLPTCLDRAGCWDADRKQRVVSTLVNGRPHGPLRLYAREDPERLESLAHWEHGVRHGPTLGFLEDGSLLVDEHHWNGKRHGRWRIIGEPGKLIELGWYAEDKREGNWCHWDEVTGKLEAMQRWHGDVSTDLEVAPDSVCPHIQGSGRRHLDPNDRDYH